jgi:hypothetical protein
MTHDQPGDGEASSWRDHRLPRVATIANFQDLERRRTQNTRRSAASPRTDTTKRPKYDKALELAKTYQAIIPDPQTIWKHDDSDETATQNGGNTCSSKSLYSSRQEAGQRRTKALVALPKSTPDPTSPLSRTSVASSTTAVGSIEPASTPTGNQQHSARISLPDIKGKRPLCPTAMREPTQREPSPNTTTEAKPDRCPNRRFCVNQRNSISMQICTELLVDQLTTALSLQQRDFGSDNRDDSVREQQQSTRRLQVLLMIEAYEGVLMTMQLESAANGDGTEPEGSGAAEWRREAGEAVPVLEHWLDSLYTLYDGTFGEDSVDDA